MKMKKVKSTALHSSETTIPAITSLYLLFSQHCDVIITYLDFFIWHADKAYSRWRCTAYRRSQSMPRGASVLTGYITFHAHGPSLMFCLFFSCACLLISGTTERSLPAGAEAIIGGHFNTTTHFQKNGGRAQTQVNICTEGTRHCSGACGDHSGNAGIQRDEK